MIDWSTKIKVYNEDCMQTMKRFPDRYFDLAICDPPYGINITKMNMGFRKKRGKTKKFADKGWDKSIPDQAYFNELFRVSKNQIIWGGNYFPLPLVEGWLFWDKDVPRNVSFADGELAWTSFKKKVTKIDIPYSGFRGAEKVRIHPTQKPVKLYKWLLDHYAVGGDKIFDSHLGSGSIAIACHDYGYELTAAELDSDYYKAARERFIDHASQLQLFMKMD